MASINSLHRFLNADLIECTGATLTEDGWVVSNKAPPKSKRDEATYERQLAIRDALTESGKLPDEIRFALLGCFEDLVLGHVPELFTSVQGSGKRPRYMAKVAIDHALTYISSAPEPRRNMAVEHVARWFKVTARTVKSSWLADARGTVPVAHATARKNALLWSRVYQNFRLQAERST
jgi:hypothetical protein